MRDPELQELLDWLEADSPFDSWNISISRTPDETVTRIVGRIDEDGVERDALCLTLSESGEGREWSVQVLDQAPQRPSAAAGFLH